MENILDAFGHVSIRHPQNPDCFLLTRALPPIATREEDVLIYDFGGNPMVETQHNHYAERILHAKIYEARDDVQSISHFHSLPLLPFTTTGIELKSITHMGAIFYDGIPLYDDYDISDGMLIRNPKEAERIARVLADKRAMLLRSHGAVVVGADIREAVFGSVYLTQNAQVQYESIQLGDPHYLTYEQGREAAAFTLTDFVLDRVWKHWQVKLERYLK